MNEKIFYQDLDCYESATEEQKNKLNKKHCFDLCLLPTEGLKKEFNAYIRYRGKQVSVSTMKLERHFYNNLCDFFQNPNNRVESILARDSNRWIKQLKGWMIQKGIRLTIEKTNVYGKPGMENHALIRYFTNMLKFTKPSEECDEIEKDIWQLKNIPMEKRENPIHNVQTFNFTRIQQPDIRNEVKKAVYLHLMHEALTTINRELAVMRKFSKYLGMKHSEINSCAEIDRDLIEEFIIYLKTETDNGNGKKDDLIKLRNILETIGKIYNFAHLEKLFLNTDFPSIGMGEFKTYSDGELKRLNAGIVKLEEQIARCMVIHQMLGNRISDTLTLHQDCLFKLGMQNMIVIHQPKSRMFEKPISEELALLIQKSINFTRQKYGERKYIFVDEQNPDKPLQYNTLLQKVMNLIRREDLRDDRGELFGFNTHMYRHYYGVKLTEMHLDDWTIAKLLGHKNVKSVKYYRKMSNQVMADETREVRKFMSDIMREHLDGWGEEYEQIRQNDRKK